MKEHLRISRRKVLRGLGAAVALPWLEAMTPVAAFGAPAAAAPVRLAFCYVPNGVVVPDWTPAKEGAAFDLSPTLQPLESVKDKLLVLTHLAHKKAFANGDGPGDHARAMSTFLTGCQVKKTSGADIKVGVSVDQIAAQKIGKATRFASLEVGCEQVKDAGNCDSGYSCAYSNNLSWRGESTPNYKEIDPRLVFDRLFGTGSLADANKDRTALYRKSVLDFVSDDAADLKRKLGTNDQRKLDEYLAGVREIEQRMAKAAVPVEVKTDKVEKVTYPRPIGYSKDKYQEHLRLMADMVVLAFQADLTRTVTFAFANDGSNRSYRFLEVPEGHHDLSHHGNNKDKLAKIQKINLFHVTQLAYLLTKLDAVKEGSGTLLDNAMVVYGSGISDGDKHNHNELPVLLAGKGGGSIKTGRHIRYPKDTPMTNLFLSMLDRAGATVDSFGDSTGRLKGLDG